MMPTQTSPPALNPVQPAPGELSAQSYTFLQAFILKESGIVVDEDKRYLIESRLRPIVVRENLASIEALCNIVALGRSAVLAKQVVEAMTTNETLFFRDDIFFDALRVDVLPAMLAAAGNRRLKIWSAASSTGQEAYSIAITLLEAGIDPARVEIVASDLSEQVLERARLGRYVQFEVNRGMPPALLARHFSKVGSEWQISSQLRSMVRFHQMDLRGSLAGLGLCDLVLCRNVLIYFSSETKEQILGSIKDILAPGGLLVLGCAETLISMTHRYERVVAGRSTFYKVKQK